MINGTLDLIADLDKSNMRGAISSFPNQIEDSFSIIKQVSINKNNFNIQSILVLGMGGSAIGADLARVLCQNECNVPIIVNRSYNIPNWVNKFTLVIASSYSGNTEETVSAFKKCRNLNCNIIVLSNGGKILQYAIDFGLDNVRIPAGLQPRAALGYSFTLIILLLNKIGFISDNIIRLIKDSIFSLEQMSLEMKNKENKAIDIAKKIHLLCPIIYGSTDLTWVAALRFRGQLAENAKMLSFHYDFPEQNHNEIEGWTANPEIMKKMSIIWLKDNDDHKGVQSRMKISFDLLNDYPYNQIVITQDGLNQVERLLKMIHFIDWISYYSALLNKLDPTPVNRINELKKIIQNVQ